MRPPTTWRMRHTLAEARSYCRAVYANILDRAFASDQPQPPTVARAWIAGAFSHGPYMIAQSLATLFVLHEPGPQASEMGRRLATHVWQRHVNLNGKWPELREFDLVEYLDADGRPHIEDGKVTSDPGHALEYGGLFLKLYAAERRRAGAGTERPSELAAIATCMPAFLARNFANGFRASTGGICKTIDLLTRQPIDASMPWWSLPETIRAGLSGWQVAATEQERRACLRMVAQCHNAFVEHYVRPASYLMAVKLRDGEGRVLDVAPAYPDADPGYHTGLSLMDALDVILGVHA